MGLPRVELAPFVGADDLLGIGDRSWPIKASAERGADQCSGCRVMAAHATVDVHQQRPAFFSEDAPLKDLVVAPSVHNASTQIAFDDLIRLRPSCKSSGLRLVER